MIMLLRKCDFPKDFRRKTILRKFPRRMLQHSSRIGFVHIYFFYSFIACIVRRCVLCRRSRCTKQHNDEGLSTRHRVKHWKEKKIIKLRERRQKRRKEHFLRTDERCCVFTVDVLIWLSWMSSTLINCSFAKNRNVEDVKIISMFAI